MKISKFGLDVSDFVVFGVRCCAATVLALSIYADIEAHFLPKDSWWHTALFLGLVLTMLLFGLAEIVKLLAVIAASMPADAPNE